MAPTATTEMAPSSSPFVKPHIIGESFTNGHILANGNGTKTSRTTSKTVTRPTSFLLDRHLRKDFPLVMRGEGNLLVLKDGRVIFDATGGAAVSCLGHGNERITTAIHEQLKSGIPYLASSFWGNDVVDELCKELINGTDGKMARVYLTGSGKFRLESLVIVAYSCSLGSEAMEASIKLSRQFFYEKDKDTPRVNFIAREGSYHGNTIGALSIAGHVSRRAPYLPFLMDTVHHISSCNPYRQRKPGESDAAFVARKADELEAKFQELGPETVIAFVAEPIVGAALGCVPTVPGYLRAMRDVCHKHGALFILDEVMCGMGRSGTLHAWQAEDVVPDLQTIGKGLGGGYMPIAAVMISERIVKALLDGSGAFIHGQTYQGMPVQAAAALEVQRVIREQRLTDNVTKQGAYMEKRLRAALGAHPNVGDIRGRGLFWGLEFVEDRTTKEPFDPKLQVAQRIHELCLSPAYNMTVYPGTGTKDGFSGDHLILAPTYIITAKEIDFIVQTISDVVHDFFESMPGA